MAVDAFIDWQPGQPALSDAQHAGNLRAIWNRLNDIAAAPGADPITSAVQSDDLRTVTFKSASGFTYDAKLPPGPFNPAGERVYGKRYAVDDFITSEGSSYIVLQPHVAGIFIADDIAARRLQLAAQRGRNAEEQRGIYLQGQAYAPGDVVYVGTPGKTEVTYYKAFGAVPVDGPAPPNYPWSQIALSPYAEFHISLEGKLAAGAVLRRYAIPRVTTLLAGLPNSAATLDVAPAAAMTLSIKVDGATVATCSFAAGSKTGVFTLAATAFAGRGQTLTVVAPATADTDAAGLAMTLCMNR